MEQTEAKFKSLFQDQILKDIKFYNSKADFLDLGQKQQWVIQGGVEFIFEQNMISLGWNAEMHLYEMIEGDLDVLLGSMDVYDIEMDQQEEMGNLKGQKITEVSFNWNWYQKYNDDMELVEEKTYIPQEIRINFESGNSLQIATILFHLKNGEITNPVFDPQGNILVALNQFIEIKTEEDLS